MRIRATTAAATAAAADKTAATDTAAAWTPAPRLPFRRCLRLHGRDRRAHGKLQAVMQCNASGGGCVAPAARTPAGWAEDALVLHDGTAAW